MYIFGHISVFVNVTTSLYHTLVRSNLEYCPSVWSPSTVSDTKAIESIQRAATRYILNYPEIKYDQRCNMLHFLTNTRLQIC